MSLRFGHTLSLLRNISPQSCQLVNFIHSSRASPGPCSEPPWHDGFKWSQYSPFLRCLVYLLNQSSPVVTRHDSSPLPHFLFVWEDDGEGTKMSRLFLFVWLYHEACGIWVPPPGNPTHALCSESTKSQPLNCQGSPRTSQDDCWPASWKQAIRGSTPFPLSLKYTFHPPFTH